MAWFLSHRRKETIGSAGPIRRRLPAGGADRHVFPHDFNEVQAALGQTVVIENKGGAGGYVGWQYVASAPPDGYTCWWRENALAINQALFKKHPSGFDPLRGL